MKALLNTLSFAVAFLLLTNFVAAQSATGGCSSVTVTSAGSYATNTYFSYVGYKNCNNGSCCRVITYGSAARPYYQLQRQNSNGSWSNIGSEQQSTQFNNISTHATYRVRIKVPRINNNFCNGGTIILYNTSGQFIGYWGQWDPNYRYTNNVVVGASVTSDLAYTFVDGGGGNSIPDGFDFGELVRMNTTGTKNYESWWLAIFENGGPQRYRSIGWTNGNGTLPTTIDLTSVWANGGSWVFQEFNSYTVQFAISSPCNTSWANLDKTFFICPAGQGCRPGEEMEEPISVSPNPANGSFRLNNYEAAPGAKFQMVVIDMSGRTVKAFNEYSAGDYNVADLPCGMYTVTVWDGDNRSHTSRLSIAR